MFRHLGASAVGAVGWFAGAAVAFVMATAADDTCRCELIGPVGRLQTGDSARLTWSTSRELGVVGFDLLTVGVPGTPSVPLNTALIAASNSPAGADYSLPIPAGLAVGASSIVLRVWAEDASHVDHVGRLGVPTETSSEQAPVRPSVAEPARSPNRPVKSGLPVVESVEVRTSRAGVCFLGFTELAAAFQLPADEVAGRADQGRLALRQQGAPVPSWGDATTGGRYFFAPRIESLFFAGNVTQVRFEEAVPPMAAIDVPAGLAAGRGHGLGRAVLEQDLQGVPTLPGAAEDDFWVWDSFLGGHPTFGVRTYPFNLAGLAATAATGAGTALVEVELVSASVAQHQFTVALNGHELGGGTWSGPERHPLLLEADASWLRSISNSLQITSSGDRLSLGYLDRFTVRYPRELKPAEGPVTFQATDAAVLESSGPDGATVEVWDVTSPSQPSRLVPSDPSVPPSRLRFQGAAGHDYVTFLRGVADRPDRLQAFGPELLRGARTGADHLVIAPDLLVTAAKGLADRRSAQGLSSLVVSLEDIRHEFAFGMATPKALASFLAYARSNWTPVPRYAVLVGDGTYDYQDHLGKGDNLIPPLLTLTLFGRAVSDVLFGDVDHDGRPDVAMGRLPVHNEAELLRVLGQMDDYGSRVAAAPKALLLADRPDDGGEFIANAQELATSLGGSFSVSSILNDALELSAARDLLFQGLAQGVSLFNYIGHGGRDRLGSGYLAVGDIAGTDFGAQQPLVVAMTCAAGQFGLPGAPCLGEAMLLKTGRAPVAVWSPSGFSIDFQAHQLNLLVAGELARQPGGTRLGDTLRRTVTAYREAGGDVVSPAIYNLLGDPALPLNFGLWPLALAARTDGDDLRLDLTGTPGATYVIEVSERLDGTDWQPLQQVAADASGHVGFVSGLSVGPVRRYYRASVSP